MNPLEILLAGAILSLGALVQGSIGFGMALIAAPVLMLLDPSLVPGPLILAGLPLALLMAWRERAAIDPSGLCWPVVGQLAGTGAAAMLLTVASQDSISIVIGTTVLLAVGLSLLGLDLPPSPRNLVSAGTLAGFMGTTSSIPGPPLALVHQHVSGARLRATLAPFFVVGAVFSLGGLAWAGRLGREELEAGAMLVPGVLAGYWGSGPLVGRIPPKLLRGCVLALSALAAATVVRQAL